jgi:hypothetical protein
MADFLDFSGIYEAVERAVKQYQSSMQTMVKEMVNMTYFELMSVEDLYPFFWLFDLDDSLACVAPAAITGITVANPGVITTEDDHGLVVGDLITMHNIVGMTELNDRIYQVATVPSATTLTVGVNTSTYTAYDSIGTVHHRGLTLATAGKNVGQLRYCSWHDEGPMVPITPEETEKDNRYHWTDVTQRPERFYHGKSYSGTGVETNQIIWHPGADAAYDLRYWFSKRPAKLVNDTDVPLMPPQFHYGIIAGTTARLDDGGVSVETPSIWPTIYSETIENLKQFNRKYWKAQENLKAEPPYLL